MPLDQQRDDAGGHSGRHARAAETHVSDCAGAVRDKRLWKASVEGAPDRGE